VRGGFDLKVGVSLDISWNCLRYCRDFPTVSLERLLEQLWFNSLGSIATPQNTG